MTGLTPDTVYYFWIQAEATSPAGEKKQSDFSDSISSKRRRRSSPDTPLGFGVKNVTKDSITYEWLAVEGMEYILEIDDGIDYAGSTRHHVGHASEFTVTGLRSNSGTMQGCMHMTRRKSWNRRLRKASSSGPYGRPMITIPAKILIT